LWGGGGELIVSSIIGLDDVPAPSHYTHAHIIILAITPMPILEPNAFERAQEHLRSAKQKYSIMMTSGDVHQITNAWSELLTQIHRAFVKLRKATKRKAAKLWYDHIEEERKNDELLSYVRHARNADEHGIDRLSEHEMVLLMRNPEDGSVHFEHTWTHDGSPFQITPGVDKSKLKVVGQMARIHLKAVVNRGITYLPPRHHLGDRIGDFFGRDVEEAHAIAVANLAIRYLDSKIVEAQAKFGSR
jgi:hypothetical protein